MNKDTKKILIVEDEESLRQMFGGKLKREGFEVLEAVDGETGLKVAFEHKPDLILLDLLMPNMNGITMFRKLRADQWGQGVPVLVLTNLSKQEVKMKFAEEELENFFLKAETEPKEIVRIIKEKLKL